MVFHFLKTRFEKIKKMLTKTGALLGEKIRSLFSKGIDESTLDELERLFYEADLGVSTATLLSKEASALYRKNPTMSIDQLIEALKETLKKDLKLDPLSILTPEKPPLVILIVGVNGNGKTTSTAKLAKRFQIEGKKVLIAACDTFRAAATEQLEIWCQRLNIDLVKGGFGSDPASVAFDGVTAAKSRGCDVILIDTAGRLHTKLPLMEELKKIGKVIKKVIPEAPHETLLVLDATAGQNAIDQANVFHSFVPLTGLILTKLDGTAKGGIVFSIQRQLHTPVKFIGIGEGIEDLEPFDANQFVSVLFD
jgi:fused signal recognition particle receptor